MRRWLIALLILILVALAARWAWQKRNAASGGGGQKLPATAQIASDTIELSATDLIAVSEHSVIQQVQVSGNVLASRTAWVKARIAGDLRELRVKEGDTVEQGQVVGRVDDSDAKDRLLQAQRQIEMAKAQVKTAQLAFDNNQALVNKGFISQTALINSQAALSSAEANLQSAMAGERIAQKAVADAVLVAPFKGQVASLMAQAGERVPVDGRVIEMVDLSQMEVMVTLNPAQASAIRIGQMAALQIEGQENVLQARLQRINPSVDPVTRSVRAYLQLPSSAGLRQGLFAQGQLLIGQSNGLAIPLSAVRTDRPQPHVLRVVDGRVASQAVELGVRGPLNDQPQGEPWVIVKGLNPGDTVLSAGAGLVREGLRMVTPGAAKPASQGN